MPEEKNQDKKEEKKEEKKGDAAKKPEKEQPEIIIYSTPTCPYCVQAKQYLKENGYKFKGIDVSADEEKAKEMVEKSGQMGVPVIDIGGTIIVGFDREKIEAALKPKEEKKEKKAA